MKPLNICMQESLRVQESKNESAFAEIMDNMENASALCQTLKEIGVKQVTDLPAMEGSYLILELADMCKSKSAKPVFYHWNSNTPRIYIVCNNQVAYVFGYNAFRLTSINAYKVDIKRRKSQFYKDDFMDTREEIIEELVKNIK